MMGQTSTSGILAEGAQEEVGDTARLVRSRC
jgi:hypothetical protein